MARIKYYDTKTGQWKYADKSYGYGSGGNIDEVYILSGGETLTDVPKDVELVIDLDGGPDFDISDFVQKTELQDEIDKTLAKAKESGLFDGDSGDDYVLTPSDKTEIAEMAAELVEVPESSGGISVTGATVGQTVKISAVDENGTPTEWEAVDFPSGVLGEKWELIAEGTITEEVDSITISADVDGNPFKLSKCYLYTIITPCEVVVDGSQYIGTRVNDNGVGNNLTSAANGTRYHQIFIEIVGRSLIATESCSTFPYNNTFSIKNHTPTKSLGFGLGDTINKVGLSLGNSKPGPHIGVNTKYEFYGVRV